MAATIGLSGGSFRGLLLDNEANADRQGSGFTPLCHLSYPDHNLYRDDAVGLNFEHIMNGAAADAARSMFTPRKDCCLLRSHAPGEASVRHPAADSSWGIESEMRYCFGSDCVDMEFTARLTDERCAPLGYVAFMWASYMNRTCGRTIHFYGICEGEEGWIRFGEDLPDGRFETGTVAHASVDPLPYEEGAETLNIVEDSSQALPPAVLLRSGGRRRRPVERGRPDGLRDDVRSGSIHPLRPVELHPGRARPARPTQPGLGLAVRHPRPGDRPDLPLPGAAPVPAVRR